jgi:hypothetical protein
MLLSKCLLFLEHSVLPYRKIIPEAQLTRHFPYGIITLYRIQVIIFGACFPAPQIRKGSVEMLKSAHRATSIPGMKVWSCIEDDRGT